MRKLLIIPIMIMSLAGCGPNPTNSDTSIKTCATWDGAAENQTYPCKWDELVNGRIPDEFGHQDQTTTVYYRGSDADCPVIPGAKCINVDDWTN